VSSTQRLPISSVSVSVKGGKSVLKGGKNVLKGGKNVLKGGKNVLRGVNLDRP